MPPQLATEFRIAGDLRESDHMDASTSSSAVSLPPANGPRAVGDLRESNIMGA